MSAIDAPPGIAFAGRADGEFVCRPRPRRLAARVLLLVLVASTLTVLLAGRRMHGQTTELLMAISLMCASVAGVGHAVRRARLRIDADGVRWGWNDFGFRAARDDIVGIDVYQDAVAFQQRRKSTWYVSARDWDHFERVPTALRRAGLPIEVHARRAPLGARLQSYGTVLDLLLVADALASVFALGVALGL
jgi:hypothetical protein